MKKGDKVNWNHGAHKAEGKIAEKFEKPLEKKIKGSKVKRNASKEEPAYLIKLDDGDQILKSESELSKGSKKK